MQASPPQPRRRLNRDHAAAAMIVALGLYVAAGSGEYPFGSVAEPGPGFLPFALGSILAACGIVIAVGAVFVAPTKALSFRDLPHALVILGVLAVAALTIERLGFRSMVLAVLLFFLLVVERRRWLIAVPLALAVAFGSFYLVNDVLRVPLPVGPWGL